jgi:Cu(I)/Ag(I) efflux system membrane fusion protein
MNKQTIIIGGITVSMAIILGAGLGYWLAKRQPAAEAIEASAGAKDPEPLYYRSPMNPEVTSPVPAKDPMDMDYIPVYADDNAAGAPAGTVTIDPVTVQNIGVRTAVAERRTMSRVINTVGRVDYDETRLYRMHPKTEGWIEELQVNTTGAPVRRDDVLFSIYSPQLVSTQQEYVLALNGLETLQASSFEEVRTGAAELVDNAMERLRLMDVPEHQIEELRRTRQVKKQLHIHAPAEGIVINVGVREGQYVTPRDQLYAIADLSKVWVLVDIYEKELPWVRVGDEAEMTIMAAPGEAFTGRLTYIYPYAESATRTVKARLEFENPELLLKPNMFADVTIQASARREAVAVPAEAIVRSGLREQVFVVRGPGKFEPREVTIGVSSDGWTEIRDGVAPGEQVVVSAQFLIDSESKLREAASKMREAKDD